MGKLLKLFICIIFCLLLSLNISAKAVTSQKLLVVTLDNDVYGSSYSIYPKTTNLLASDIINSLRTSHVNAIDLVSAQKALNSARLNSNYKKFVSNYKQNYSIDYDILQKIGKEFGVNKVVLLGGGFDTEKYFLKESNLNWLNLPGHKVIDPQVTYNFLVTIVNLDDRTVVWEQNYENNFSSGNFANKDHGFSENYIPVTAIKRYSAKLSPEITAKIHFLLTDSGVTTNPNSNNLTTDGIMTKDGQFYSTDPQRVKDIRSKNFKKWSINDL